MLRLILIMMLTVSSQAQAASSADGKVAAFNLPAAIYDVKGIGNWRKGEAAGQIRLIITRSNKRDDIFIQWVQWNDKGPESIKKTVQVQEIRKSANFKTTFIRRETVKGVRQLVLGLENLYDRSAARAVIQIEDVGRYTCFIQ